VKDHNGEFIFPRRLGKFMEGDKLRIERVNQYSNPDNSDILFVVETIPGTDHDEVFVKVRTETGSDRFIILPTQLLEMKQCMISKLKDK
jgi:hypothetical protein